VPESAPGLQAQLDGKVAAFDKLLADLAKADPAVVRLDLLADWPKDAEARGALTVGGWSLSDLGHARIAAAVCDAILQARPGSP
jgi:hypothetical protein